MDVAALRRRMTTTYRTRRDQAKDLVDRIPVVGRLVNEFVRIEFIDRCMLIALVVAILAFAAAFYLIDLVDPDQIVGLDTRLDSLYFTVTTLLTVGFGDIHAQKQLARGVVLFAMVFNVAVIATAAAAINRRIHQKPVERAEILAADPDRARRRHRGSRERRTEQESS